MKPYTGENNSIYDLFDKIFIPIVLSFNEMHLAVINILKKSILLYITSNFEGYPEDPSVNPILQNLLRFLIDEYLEKKKKNLSLNSWKLRYIHMEEIYTKKYK